MQHQELPTSKDVHVPRLYVSYACVVACAHHRTAVKTWQAWCGHFSTSSNLTKGHSPHYHQPQIMPQSFPIHLSDHYQRFNSQFNENYIKELKAFWTRTQNLIGKCACACVPLGPSPRIADIGTQLEPSSWQYLIKIGWISKTDILKYGAMCTVVRHILYAKRHWTHNQIRRILTPLIRTLKFDWKGEYVSPVTVRVDLLVTWMYFSHEISDGIVP